MLKLLNLIILLPILLLSIESFKLIDEQFNINKNIEHKDHSNLISKKSRSKLFSQMIKNVSDKEVAQQQQISAPITPVFQPKLTESPNDEDYNEIEDYYDYDLNSDYHFETNHINIKKPTGLVNTSTNLPPSKWITKNATAPSKFNLNSIFEFVEYILRPTNPSDNTIENRFNKNEYDYLNSSDYYFFDDENSTHAKDFDKQNISTTVSTSTIIKPLNLSIKNESLPWYSKENVCISKMTYQKQGKISFDYWYISECKNKIDSEFCVTKIQAGYSSFEIHSTIFCCPNHHLNLTLDSCIQTKHKINVYEELDNSFKELNSTISNYIFQNESTSTELLLIFKNKNDIINDFYKEFNQIYYKIIKESSLALNNTKYTIYLWDNNRFLDYINSIMNYHDYDLKQKLEKIIVTIKNHIVKQHHTTQSIVSNQIELETLASKYVRFSKLNGENRSFEFVNCKEMKYQNQYYEQIPPNNQHNYRLLIHKLQTGSLLIPFTKTVYQVLTDKILKPTNAYSSQYKIFQQIFSKSSDLMEKELNVLPTGPLSKSNNPSSSKSSIPTSPITIFVPTDNAFKQLRQDQIDSLISDEKCGYKFLTSNIVYEEVCPNQIMKYNTEYSSPNQRASFISVTENSTSFLFFNGQIVNLSKSYINSASNGMIYRLNTLKLNGVVDFLYDVVTSFKKKFPVNFLNSLNSNWLEIIKNHSTNSTLFMPFEDKHGTIDNRSSLLPLNNINNTFTNETFLNISNNYQNYSDRINIFDYMFKKRYTMYELNNGDIITSITNKNYLINSFQFESQIPDFMNFIPLRNFQRKSINCQQMEMPDVNACSSQLIVFKSDSNLIPKLDNITLIEYIANDQEISIYKSLIDLCGNECKTIFEKMISNVSSSFNNGFRGGFTIMIPTNDYFTREAKNSDKFTKNIELLKKAINSNIFYGTNCYFYLKMNVIIENLLNRRIKSKKVFERIVKSQSYLSKEGILVHKTKHF